MEYATTEKFLINMTRCFASSVAQSCSFSICNEFAKNMGRVSKRKELKMKKKNLFSRVTAVACAIVVTVTGIPVGGVSVTKVSAAEFDDESINIMLDSGGYKTEIFGIGTEDWGQTWVDRTEHFAPSTTYLTENYRETVGTVPTNDWASSVVFDQYSESLYAHPLAFRAASNGMQMASPAVSEATSPIDGEPMVESLLNDDTVELVVGGSGFTAKDAKVDVATDWTYEIVMENSAGTSLMRATLAKGTPYAYYQFDNVTPTISLGAGATNLSVYKNTTGSNMIGISVKNNKDGKTHYYLVAAPSGTTWTNAGGKLTANLPSDKNYMSVAILPDNTDDAFELYSRYAFNFITDTKVEWEYLQNASKVATRYNVETTNMETGAVGGDTIMALYPHQWRYSDSDYTRYTYDTIRGTMKTVVGSSYITEMTYSGIVTGLPCTTDEDQLGRIKDQLGYLYDYRSNLGDPKWICNLEGQYGGYDTYWIGKNLNTMSDAIILADQFSDDASFAEMRDNMVAGIENYVEFWFDPYQAYINGNMVDDYFYYDQEYGTLIGYPASYSSDKELNDHHFHYGYWIKTAAVLAMQDPEWAQEWGGMVYEMISDIANTNRDGSSYNENSPAKYPFLRNFDIYEGHSWASGVANYEYDKDGNIVDPKGGLAGGNNQESSSEAVNAWASLIMWGDVMQDTRIRDLGIYLYTTEIAAIEDYYFDVHDEIFTDSYEDRDNFDIQTVTRLFGGRYDHTAWWTENSIEVSTILMLPISGATMYLGKYPEKVKAVYDSIKPSSTQWKNFVTNKEQICANYGKTDMLVGEQTNQEIVCEYYAYYDPEAALDMYIVSDDYKIENGESRAHAIQYITSLQAYGNQNFDITASWPTAFVMEKNGVKTYVAQNHTDKDIRVYYSDGAYVDVPANSDYAGAKNGNEENPNVDEGEISGSKQKFILEVHKENYDGTGYDVTTRTVSVKSENNMYTYEPAEIAGFTFDSSNEENVLTVDVTEGNLNTVVVYYNRESYTISYELDGGSASGNPTSYRYGSSISLNAASKTGYVFEGWYLDEDYSIPFAGITETLYGNITLYAKLMDANLIATYKVEYWIMSDNREFYSLAEDQTEIITSYVGTEVTAVDKAYSGYILNENSTTSGVVLPDEQLVLRMYYDIPAPDKTGDMTSGHGIIIDKNNKVTIYAADMQVQVLYYKTFADKDSAESLYEQVINGEYGGLPGYNPTVSDGVYSYTVGTMTDAQYIVWAFNDGTGIKEISMKNIAEAKEEQIQNATVKANYTVKYFKQDVETDSYTEITEDEKTIEGEVSTGVVAPVNSYEGYIVNADYSNLTGTVLEDGSLVLNVYYDLARTTISTHKYTLEVYKEKLDGSGYDMTFKVISLDTTDNTFTYSPVEIEGFVFDDTNENNNLSVNVSEGTIETVRVYYNRAVYTIKYMLDGGSANNSTSYKYGEAVSFTDATKSGYIFTGWFTDKNFTNEIKGIEAGDTGNVTVYAKFVDANSISGYTVEHYKMSSDGKSYELADADTIEGATVGVTVEAEPKEYSGYTLNANSVINGIVVQDDKLVIRLYYDVDIVELASPFAGAKLDESGNIILYTNKTNSGEYLVYCSEFSSEADAQKVYEEKLETHSPSGMPGYIMTANGDIYETNIGQKSDSKYLVFIFNRGKGSESEEDAYMIKVSDIANSNAEPTKVNYNVKYYVEDDSDNMVLYDTKTFEAYAGYVAHAPELVIATHYLDTDASTLSEIVSEDGTTVFNVYYVKADVQQTKITVEINGYQVNTRIGGVRTVYSVEETIDDKQVVERGLIYGLAKGATDQDMFIDSDNNYVKAYAATENGVIPCNVSASSTATSYAMTMKFGDATTSKQSTNELTCGWKVRAYAKLSDGTYVYSDVYNYTIFDIAEEVYETLSSVDSESHDYLYQNILAFVDPNYKEIQFQIAR